MNQFTKAIDVDPNTIYLWMDAQSMPEEAQIEVIAEFSSTDLDEVRVIWADNFLENTMRFSKFSHQRKSFGVSLKK